MELSATNILEFENIAHNPPPHERASSTSTKATTMPPPRGTQKLKWTPEEVDSLISLRAEHESMPWDEFGEKFFPTRTWAATRAKYSALMKYEDPAPAGEFSVGSENEWEDEEPEIMPQPSNRKRRSELMGFTDEEFGGNPDKRFKPERSSARHVARRGGRGGLHRLQRTGPVGRATGQAVSNPVSSTNGSSGGIPEIGEFQRVQKYFRPEFMVQLLEEGRDRERESQEVDDLRAENLAVKKENLELKAQLDEMKAQWQKMETFKSIFKEFSQPHKQKTPWEAPGTPGTSNGRNE